MHYEGLVERLRNETYWLGGSEPYSHDIHPVICDEAAEVITDLIACIEATENERDRLREAMKLNCLQCESMHKNGNCMEVGGFCTSVPAAYCPLIPKLLKKISETESRAERAERERNAAIKMLRKIEWCNGCKNFRGLQGCRIGALVTCNPQNDMYVFGEGEE